MHTRTHAYKTMRTRAHIWYLHTGAFRHAITNHTGALSLVRLPTHTSFFKALKHAAFYTITLKCFLVIYFFVFPQYRTDCLAHLGVHVPCHLLMADFEKSALTPAQTAELWNRTYVVSYTHSPFPYTIHTNKAYSFMHTRSFTHIHKHPNAHELTLAQTTDLWNRGVFSHIPIHAQTQ